MLGKGVGTQSSLLAFPRLSLESLGGVVSLLLGGGAWSSLLEARSSPASLDPVGAVLDPLASVITLGTEAGAESSPVAFLLLSLESLTSV